MRERMVRRIDLLIVTVAFTFLGFTMGFLLGIELTAREYRIRMDNSIPKLEMEHQDMRG